MTPQENDYWMGEALRLAQQAAAAGEVPVDLPLEEALAAIDPVAPTARTAFRRAGSTLAALSGGGASDLAAGLAAGALSAGRRQPSLWSCEVDGMARLMACEGLPGPREMIGLMSLDAPIWKEEPAA